ncbi:MAG TPA: adenylate kinase [Aggregatilineales bacterium]|jgi:adenylate kinase|nr:adenylate kinase [Chloroflexota bacterium]HOA23734.1 adenylate kinase [Aggregatilineales bacterium]HPV06316.1 adenylate kinase [Aggregatilineales bacterium]HQA67192.1 adenylate kinase [Aggregatilineales bacterium]HQE17840.1 adenylate kinase [Aggregatilineales bacterium]
MTAAYIMLMGPPGSGKGTQAKRLVEALGIPHVSSGDLFRAMKVMDTPLAREIQAIMARGELVPDETTIRVVEERLREEDARKGAILDGFPRTVPQAEALDNLLAELGGRLEPVLLFRITEDEAVRRISGRRTCPQCERVYHVAFHPPQVEDVCDVDGSTLVQRADDRPEVVRERYQLYLNKTEPLVEYYRAKGILVEIDAMRDIDQITPDIVEAVRQRSQAT